MESVNTGAELSMMKSTAEMKALPEYAASGKVRITLLYVSR